MTATQLLAAASGIKCSGPHRCVYCGAAASTPYTLSESFTTRDTLRCPGSQFACAGCLLALEESGEAVYHTGERYRFTKAFRRMCSWIITNTKAVAATKGHIDYLRGICLSPPEPPFAISLAVSGQKHVLYRGVACLSRESVSVTLEGERIDYRPPELAAMLALAGRVCAATGKPALIAPPGPSLWFRVCERYSDGERIAEEWSNVWQSPLARLAAFLTPKKEDSDREYPCDRHDGIPPSGRGADRPEPKADGRGRGAERERGSQATLFGDV